MTPCGDSIDNQAPSSLVKTRLLAFIPLWTSQFFQQARQAQAGPDQATPEQHGNTVPHGGNAQTSLRQRLATPTRQQAFQGKLSGPEDMAQGLL
jgi:hypothetical protein